MCGFIAALTQTYFPDSAAQSAMQRLFRRGPDGAGEWRGEGVYLGHRRLAIIDLDHRSDQPLHSVCGRYVIVFNGEIYNYRALRVDLESSGVVFRTSSDTEVILALFVAEGEAMLPKLRGMFAFVIWDKLARRAFAARDAYGIKPLYVATTPQGTVFASQVKALMATGLVSREPDARGQAGFWMLGFVPEPHTWYRDIRALPAGHCLWVDAGRPGLDLCFEDIGSYWHSSCVKNLSYEEVEQRVLVALRESVQRHIVADVPVGVFLSGGIDSSALAGMMIDAGVSKLQGVTLAYDEFKDRPEDEAPGATEIARYYGIRHHIRRVTRDEFLADIPRILDAMDQPSTDGVNTWYASKAAAELGLKVVVSGVGGDELFKGYPVFKKLMRIVAAWRRYSRWPGAMPLAQLAANLRAQHTGNSRWRYAPQWAETMAGAWWMAYSISSPEQLPGLMGEDMARQGLLDFNAEEWVTAMTRPTPYGLEAALGKIESVVYMRNQLLRDSDWASMDHGLELRTPLVDAHLLHQLSLYRRYIDLIKKKKLLPYAPSKPLPESFIARRKTGFVIPVPIWLQFRAGSVASPESRGPLPWARVVAAAYQNA